MRRILLSLVATVAGYATIVIGAILAQDLLFGGVSYDDSPTFEILVGGGGTALFAVAGGYVASRIVRSRAIIPISLLVGWLIVERTILIVTGGVTGPVWYECLASASEVGGVLVGTWLYHRSRGRSTA